MFGRPDSTTALILLGLLVGLLLAMLSYHSPGRHYPTWGVGLLCLATAVALLVHALSVPSAGTSIVLLLVLVALLLVLLTYQNRVWGHVAWWLGVLLFLLALPWLGAGRGDLAFFGLVAGPAMLMLVAALHPQIPAAYARAGTGDPGPLTSADLSAERQRYTRLAGGITLVSLAGAWLVGGVPVVGAGGGGGASLAVVGLDTLRFNPDTLNVKAGTTVTVTFKNGGNTLHDFVTEGLEQNAKIVGLGGGKEQTATFRVAQPGTYQYICSEPGHKEGGMVGKIVAS